MTTATLRQPLLLATDLSCRCDRALDRAALLARELESPLIALHVLESGVTRIPADETGTGTNPAQLARRCLQETLADDQVLATVLVEEGEPGEVALRVANEQRCGLIVTGLARDEILGRFLLGTTVDRLIARAIVPLLIVRKRARRPYRRIVVATDFSPVSRHALESTVKLFPQAELTLFHAHQGPARDRGGDDDDADLRAIRDGACAGFLDQVLIPAEARRRLRVVVRRGAASLLLHDHARDDDTDLVVVGHSRSTLRQLLIGSTAQQILDRTPCDVLVVPEPRIQIA